MSLIPQPIIPSPTFPPSTEEIVLRRKAQSDALESLRINHPELFTMRVSPNDPGVRCLKTKFGVDVTNDGLLEVLFRPHAKRICESLAPHGRKEAPTAFMYFIVKDALNNLDIDIDDLAKIGIVFGCNHECTDETYIHGYISYLGNALGNLHRLKTRTQKRINNTPEGKERIRIAEFLKRREEALKKQPKKPISVVEGDLLGLRSTSAAAKPEEKDLLIFPSREEELTKDLASIKFGGSSHTRKHKSRKNRKVRKTSKSRKHTRK